MAWTWKRHATSLCPMDLLSFPRRRPNTTRRSPRLRVSEKDRGEKSAAQCAVVHMRASFSGLALSGCALKEDQKVNHTWVWVKITPGDRRF